MSYVSGQRRIKCLILWRSAFRSWDFKDLMLDLIHPPRNQKFYSEGGQRVIKMMHKAPFYLVISTMLMDYSYYFSYKKNKARRRSGKRVLRVSPAAKERKLVRLVSHATKERTYGPRNYLVTDSYERENSIKIAWERFFSVPDNYSICIKAHNDWLYTNHVCRGDKATTGSGLPGC